jgi:hypothetical protein
MAYRFILLEIDQGMRTDHRTPKHVLNSITPPCRTRSGSLAHAAREHGIRAVLDRRGTWLRGPVGRSSPGGP